MREIAVFTADAAKKKYSCEAAAPSAGRSFFSVLSASIRSSFEPSACSSSPSSEVPDDVDAPPELSFSLHEGQYRAAPSNERTPPSSVSTR